MRFFRRHRSFIWLGLFALCTQLALSFGHVHLNAVKHYADAAASSACGAKTQSPCPAQDDDEDHCAICWTISIAGTLVVPAAPVVDLPPRERMRVEPLLAVRSLRGTETVHFQARAPPLA
jgi:hypothetical protein